MASFIFSPNNRQIIPNSVVLYDHKYAEYQKRAMDFMIIFAYFVPLLM